MKAGLLLVLLILCQPALQSGEPVGAEEASEWTGASYPEWPTRPWFALPFYVNWAYQDARGRVWLGSKTTGWPKDDDETLIRKVKARMEAAFPQDRPLLAGAEILHQDAAGRLWIRVCGKKTYVLACDGKNWIRSPLEVQVWNYAQEHLYEDAQGRVWLSGNGAICRFEKGSFEILQKPAQPAEPASDYFSHATVIASPDGLVLFNNWSTDHASCLYREGHLFALNVPSGDPDAKEGWDCRWPVDGNAVLHTGYRSHRARVTVPRELMGLPAEEHPRRPDGLDALLERMDSERFEIRDAASQDLLKLIRKRDDGRSLIAELLKEKGHSLEVTDRLNSILATYDDPKMSRLFATGPWFASGFLHSAVPRARGAVLSNMVVRTPAADGADDREEKGIYWIHPDGKRFKVPIDDQAGSNLDVRYDGQGAPLVSEWRYGGFCWRDGRFVRAIPTESDRTVKSLFAVDATGRAFFSQENDTVFVSSVMELPASPWQRWPQAQSLLRAGTDQVWVDFETSAVSRMVEGEWSAIQTSEGELNQGQIEAQGDEGLLLFKGRIRADPDRYWLLDTNPEAERSRPSDERLSNLAAGQFKELHKCFSAVRYGDLSSETNRASLTGDGDGNLWTVEPVQDGAPVVSLIAQGVAHPLNVLIAKDAPSFKRADRVFRLPRLDGVVLLHDRWEAEGAAATPLVLRWQDGQLHVRPLYPWDERYGALTPYSVFLSLDGDLFVGKGGHLGTLRIRGDRAEFLPEERPPVLEHPRGTFWYQDLTDEAYPYVLGLKALVVRRGKQSWRLPLRCTTPRSTPVVDRKGLVWIGLGNGVTGMAVSNDGVRVVRQVPWDLPGRTVYNLIVDGQNRLWGYDRRSEEVLCLELDKIP